MRTNVKTLLAIPILLLAVGAMALAQSQPPDQTQPPAPKPTGPVAPGGCVTPECHANVKQHRAVHGPVSVNACDACHTLVSESEHTYVQAREGLEMCTFCHDMNVDDAMVVHEPMKTGQCVTCHSPHGGTDNKFLKADSANDLCKQCHEDVIGAKRAVHGPVAAGACAACHSPHASPYPNLLSAQGPELCNGCHVTTETQLNSLRHVHEPASRDCQTCHFAHASDYDMMLKDEPQALCISCHETIQHMVETATTQHAAVTGDRKCLNCHEPHASDFPRILNNSPMDLCFECHDRTIKLDDGTTLGNIKQVIETGISLHGPIAQDNCAACHEIHGGNNFRLLIKEYPPEFYAPFAEESYALCFNCHESQILRDAQTTSLTDFRNGDENLHFLHVNREKKGRTCRACHETHASNKAKHVRESVPFGNGGWMLPINFQKTDNGGTCAPGCHLPYDYDRVSPIEYQPPAEAAVWPTETATDGVHSVQRGAP